ncbi:MAG TPA: helix-turn-helix domain-containing protein [Verrucomicrobiae bacterium]|nr:helix-turn-helix domain-containing protein [Verrucomicrobiae bacterium]
MIWQNDTACSGDPTNLVAVPLVLRVTEFAARYGVSARTVWTWLADGLPHYKLSPRQTRIPLREADEWVTNKFFRKRKR